MGVKFSGFDEINVTLDKVQQQGPAAIDSFLKKEAEVLRGKAQELTPVDTGQLREGWQRTDPENGQIQVYDNVEYAAHVEFGHRTRNGGFVKGRKMLHRALLQAGKSFSEDAEAILRGLLK